MSIYQRVPGFPINQHVAWLWFYSDFYPDHEREHVLPDGSFELIINLEDRPRKLFDKKDFSIHQAFRRSWISGAHKEYLVIDALPGSSMIGAHFKPGGAAPFLGMPAGELSNQVVELEAIWGPRASEWRERLLAATTPEAKLDLLEQLLLNRLAKRPSNDARKARVNWAITTFRRNPHLKSIRAVSHQLGMSHKHFIDEFRREVGLTPKLFCRIRRFQEVLGQIQARKSVSWADVAYSCGYFDQAHFVNDFVALAGNEP